MSSTTQRVAGALFRSGCIKFGTFTIKSGAQSPYYIDMARLLASPNDFCIIADIAAEKIKQIIKTDHVVKLASIELKGALIVPCIASRLELPCVIVRKETKVYGVTGRVAGADVEKGDEILFFDDVVSEGLSKIEGVKPLQELGAIVKHLLVVVDREQGGKENLEKLGFKVHALASISEVVRELLQNGNISKAQSEAVLNYINKQIA
ncbi:MAG TPA: phosphoribosyltransferase family protein [Candidatus Nanoarchaeia archaeon]|nr:phosphoribosyltransferase family protein [Candidatus Nanoarchaeia archaeon]